MAKADRTTPAKGMRAEPGVSRFALPAELVERVERFAAETNQRPEDVLVAALRERADSRHLSDPTEGPVPQSAPVHASDASQAQEPAVDRGELGLWGATLGTRAADALCWLSTAASAAALYA